MSKSLNTRCAMPHLQRSIHRIVNKTVFAHKKHRAFWVSQSGVKPFYQSVGRSFGIGNLPKKQRCFRSVGAGVGQQRIQRLLSGMRQKHLFVSNVTDTQGGDDMAVLKYSVQGNVSRAADLNRHEKTFNHGDVPIVVEGPKTARAIWQMLYAG